MLTEKTYAYTYEDYEEQGKNAETMVKEILSDPDFPELKKNHHWMLGVGG